jgi:hypothetical protein
MRWFKPNIRSSIYALLSLVQPLSADDSVAEFDIEDIRASMLALVPDATGHRVTQVTRRIRYAMELEDLWYLRGDLMAVLAGMHGELAARQKLESITKMFEYMLVPGLRSRPSPLSASRD